MPDVKMAFDYNRMKISLLRRMCPFCYFCDKNIINRDSKEPKNKQNILVRSISVEIRATVACQTGNRVSEPTLTSLGGSQSNIPGAFWLTSGGISFYSTKAACSCSYLLQLNDDGKTALLELGPEGQNKLGQVITALTYHASL